MNTNISEDQVFYFNPEDEEAGKVGDLEYLRPNGETASMRVAVGTTIQITEIIESGRTFRGQIKSQFGSNAGLVQFDTEQWNPDGDWKEDRRSGGDDGLMSQDRAMEIVQNKNGFRRGDTAEDGGRLRSEAESVVRRDT